MNEPAKFNSVVSFLWAIADLLNGAFKKSEFQKIILPFTVLRRLDYALEKTKDKVLETEHTLKEKGLENRHGQLCKAAGYAFYNTSKFTYESLLHDDANPALNPRQYVMGFSPTVRSLIAALHLSDSHRSDPARAGDRPTPAGEGRGRQTRAPRTGRARRTPRPGGWREGAERAWRPAPVAVRARRAGSST